jgi:hypothetical protein
MPPTQPLKPVMLVRPPLSMLDDQGFWDELKEAGVNEVAIQWLALQDKRGGASGPSRASGTDAPKILKDEDHHPRAVEAAGGREARAMPVGAFEPDPKLYLGMKTWSPPDMPASVEDQAARLKASLERAQSQGFTLWMMDDKGYFRIGGTGTGRPAPVAVSVCDPETPVYTGARIADQAANYPMFSAVVLDGPDFKWDIKPGARDDIAVENFDDAHQRKFAQSIGLTTERVTEGRDRFVQRLRSLTPAYVYEFVGIQTRGASAYLWWTEDPAVADWLRYKHAVVEWALRATIGEIRRRAPGLKVGTSSRVPAMTILNGHNLRRERTFTDFQLPKEYWWLAVAGIRGTVQNWVSTLVAWNPGLSEEQASRWFSAAFDYAMPSDYLPSAYGKEATKQWYETTVRDQTRKMISSVGGVDRFVPFVGLEHFNLGWMPASELRGVLAEMQAQGVKRYCYYTYNSLTPDVWDVIRQFSRG